jgi:hypothetical protein
MIRSMPKGIETDIPESVVTHGNSYLRKLVNTYEAVLYLNQSTAS